MVLAIECVVMLCMDLCELKSIAVKIVATDQEVDILLR